MRILKIAGWVLGGVVALVALVVVWLLFWFDANQYKPDIEKLVQEKTGRTLTLQGDLKLSFWPSLAVELGKTSLGNASGYGDEPMLSMNQVRLGVKVWPLLHKQVEVGAIEVDSPTVALVKKSETENNWSDLGKSDEASAQPEQTEPQSGNDMNVSIERVTIKNANVSIDDQQAHELTRVSDFNLTTGALQPGKPVDMASSFVYDARAADGSTQSIKAKLKTRIDADMEQKKYVLTAPTIDIELTRGKNKAIPLSLTAAAIRADLQAQTAEVVKLLLTSDDLKLAADIKAEHINDAPQAQGTMTLSPVSLRALAKRFAVDLPVTSDAKALTNFGMSTQFAATTHSAELNQLTIKLDDSTITGKVAINDFDSKAMRFTLNVDRINADRYLAPVSEQPEPTEAVDTGPVKIPGEAVRGLDIVGQLTIGDAIIRKMDLTQVKLGVDARNDKLHLNPFEATVYEGKFKGDIVFDASGKVPRVSAEEHVAGINFASLFKAMYKKDNITGKGSINLKLTGSGADSDALKRTLSGNLDFKVDNGAYEGVDLWWEIRRARALLKQQPVPTKSTTPRTAFTSLRGSGAMNNGVFSSEDLDAALQYLKLTGKGSADLVQSTIDYKLQATVLTLPSEAKLAAADQEASNDLAGLTIPITVTGALTDPKVRPDVQGMIKERAKQELDKQKEKAKEKIEQKLDENKDKLKEKLQDKLKGLFGGG